MNYKTLKRKLKVQTEMRKHYQELFETAVKELKFEKLQVQALMTLIDEIHTITDEKLIKAVIENGKNRHNLDKIIHAKQIFK